MYRCSRLLHFRKPSHVCPELSVITEAVNRANHTDEGFRPNGAFDRKTLDDWRIGMRGNELLKLREQVFACLF
jgi:hypothetical protein